MSRDLNVRMELACECTVCGRLVRFTYVDNCSVVKQLRGKGACVVGPNKSGHLVIEGCGKCERFALPGMRKKDRQEDGQ